MNMHVKKPFFLLAILFLLICGIVSYTFFQVAMRTQDDASQTYQTIRAANQSLISINEAALQVSTFLITNNLDAIMKLPEIIVSAQLNLSTLNQLTQDNSDEIKIFKQLQPLFDEKIAFLKNIITNYKAGNKEQAFAIASEKNRLNQSHEIIQLIINIKKIEVDQLQKALADSITNKAKANLFYILAGIINIVIFIGIYCSLQSRLK